MIEKIKKFVFGGEKERTVLSLVDEHVNLLINASDIFRAALQRDDRSILGEVCELEKLGDSVRREAILRIYEGAFLPSIRPMLCDLIEMIDEVLDELEDLAILFLRIKLPEVLREDLTRIAEINHVMTGLLYDAIQSMNGEELGEILLKIKIREEEVDAIKARIYEKVHKVDFDSYLDWHFLMKFIDKLVNVSDLIEDAADQVQVISVSFG
ncbi:MAG: TIGR00153 family protein [Archaeoglobaceae archaeon]